MAARINDYDWTKAKVDRLRDLASRVEHIHPDVVYPEGPWTVLKLICLFQLHGTYLRIMLHQQKKGYVGRLFYIDLNAGAGIVAVEGTKAKVAGSALIAANVHRVAREEGYEYDYDHYIFVEPDAQRADALEARLLDWMAPDKFTLFRTGADEAMEQILDLLQPEDHYLCVFDPYGFKQGTWQCYGRLIENTGRGDLVINFQTPSVKRTSPEQRRAFFGPDFPGGYLQLSEDKILASFKEDVLRKHRPVSEHVRVKARKDIRYYYDMIYAVARTGGGSPFMNAFNDVDKRVSKLDGGTIHGMLSHRDVLDWG